jgi:2-polyprenyl-3-methyl-5-hydroxy-6-metoxy-1,4-benzoquinol methylase
MTLAVAEHRSPGADGSPRPRAIGAAAAGEEACILCDGPLAYLLTGYDRMYPRAADFDYGRCRGCGLVALLRRPADAELHVFYPADYAARIAARPRRLNRRVNRLAIRYLYGVESARRPAWQRAVARALAVRVLRGIHEPHGAGRLLDIGCGAGGLLETYRQLGWSAAGIENDPHATAACRRRGLSVHEGTVFDAPYRSEFDLVLMSHVIEHLADPVAVLRCAAQLLAPGGKLLLITPNARSLGLARYGSCWYGLDAPRHLFLFDPLTVRRLAALAGLNVRRVVTRAEARILCKSRQYALTQGHVLPAGVQARAAVLAASARCESPHRLYREAVTPLAVLAARVGRGELLEVELTAR